MSRYTGDASLDFKKLKKQVSIGLVLAIYGLDRKLRFNGDQLIGPCPLHGGDNPTAFRVNLRNGLWHCFTACSGGDVVTLIRRIKHCTYTQAAHHLRSIAQGNHMSPLQQKRDVLIQRTPFKPFLRRIPLNPRHVFLQQQKGIFVDTAIQFGTGQSDRSHFLKDTIAVRLHDLHGLALGYCGRRLEPKMIARWGKWRFPKHFPKGHVLYNAHRAVFYRSCGIVLVECPWAVMRLAQAGIRGAVALLGTQLTSTHIAWLAQTRAVLVILDGDPAGRKATQNIFAKLNHFTDVRSYPLDDGFEPEDLTDSQLAALVHQNLFSS